MSHQTPRSSEELDPAELLKNMPKPEIGDLNNWLYVATGGLCAPAKEAIAREIGDHYRAAIEDGLAEGLTQLQAELAAMQSLGSAKAARREFGKVYLTHGEYRFRHRTHSPDNSPLFYMAMLLAIAPSPLVMLLPDESPLAGGLLAVSILVFICAHCLRLIFDMKIKAALYTYRVFLTVALILQLSSQIALIRIPPPEDAFYAAIMILGLALFSFAALGASFSYNRRMQRSLEGRR